MDEFNRLQKYTAQATLGRMLDTIFLFYNYLTMLTYLIRINSKVNWKCYVNVDV
jgi:hypothetical protein